MTIDGANFERGGYKPPRDSRPEAVRKAALERHVIRLRGRDSVGQTVRFTAVSPDTGILPPEVEIGYVGPAPGENAEPELVIRKEPRVDMWEEDGKGKGVCDMGDGQRRMVDSEPGRVREFLLGGQAAQTTFFEEAA